MASIIWSAPSWLLPAAILSTAALAILIWSYVRAPATFGVRSLAGALKAIGILALAACLIEPLLSSSRPRPGANVFVLLADSSQSLLIRDSANGSTRAELMKKQLAGDTAWQTRLGQDFEIRRYAFDRRLRPLPDFSELAFEGDASELASALETIARRYRNRPIAGVLLFTDGNATDLTAAIDEQIPHLSQLPPVYPVVIGAEDPPQDASLDRVAVSQTNFEAAPIALRAQVAATGYENQRLSVDLLDESGTLVETQTIDAERDDSQPLTTRFQLRPEHAGIGFYRLRVTPASESAADEKREAPREATLANNERLVMVDRGGGPYRVLYVSGRPNWEFKFLRRAIEADPEVQLVGMVRIARREAKFKFRSRGESANPLFRGFGNEQDEQVEQYDEPVLVRLGTRDQAELRDGFPKAADVLFEYHAVILDDLESQFFTQDQMALVEEFVSRRGGGLLMLGGGESFAEGGYDRTPLGELLPVYLDRLPKASDGGAFRLSLSREGWLTPWARLRTTEQEENERLAAMPEFRTVNRLRGIKPGATILARADDSSSGATQPALVAHRYGKGRAAALLIGDMWRWQLKRPADEPRDQEKAWRQTLRWLLAEVPQRIEVTLDRKAGEPGNPVEIKIDARDAKYQALDNATVNVTVTSPDGNELKLAAVAAEQQAGVYVTRYVPRQAGAYRAKISVVGADGSAMGSRETGWAAQPAADEFRRLTPDRRFLQQIADETGGELIHADSVESLVADLPNRKVPINEPWVYPLWHQPFVFLFAICCLCGEWGLRRWKGLP